MKRLLVFVFFITTSSLLKAQKLDKYNATTEPEPKRIYCAKDLEKALHNLAIVKKLLCYDFEAGEIPEKKYFDYMQIIDYTFLSINMVLTKETNPVDIFLDETDINFRYCKKK